LQESVRDSNLFRKGISDDALDVLLDLDSSVNAEGSGASQHQYSSEHKLSLRKYTTNVNRNKIRKEYLINHFRTSEESDISTKNENEVKVTNNLSYLPKNTRSLDSLGEENVYNERGNREFIDMQNDLNLEEFKPPSATSKRPIISKRRSVRDISPKYLTAHPSQTTTTVQVPDNNSLSLETKRPQQRNNKKSKETPPEVDAQESLPSTKYYRNLLNRRLSRSNNNTSLPLGSGSEAALLNDVSKKHSGE